LLRRSLLLGIIGPFALISCGPVNDETLVSDNAPHSSSNTVLNETKQDGSPEITPEVQTPIRIIAPIEQTSPGECIKSMGHPNQENGEYKSHDDVAGFSMSYQLGYFGCEHEGPQKQYCYLEENGIVAWVEKNQKLNIVALGGPINIIIERNLGVRCMRN